MKNYQYAATSVAIPTKPAKWKTKGGQVISGTSFCWNARQRKFH